MHISFCLTNEASLLRFFRYRLHAIVMMTKVTTSHDLVQQITTFLRVWLTELHSEHLLKHIHQCTTEALYTQIAQRIISQQSLTISGRNQRKVIVHYLSQTNTLTGLMSVCMQHREYQVKLSCRHNHSLLVLRLAHAVPKYHPALQSLVVPRTMHIGWSEVRFHIRKGS